MDFIISLSGLCPKNNCNQYLVNTEGVHKIRTHYTLTLTLNMVYVDRRPLKSISTATEYNTECARLQSALLSLSDSEVMTLRCSYNDGLKGGMCYWAKEHKLQKYELSLPLYADHPQSHSLHPFIFMYTAANPLQSTAQSDRVTHKVRENDRFYWCSEHLLVFTDVLNTYWWISSNVYYCALKCQQPCLDLTCISKYVYGHMYCKCILKHHLWFNLTLLHMQINKL